MINKLNSIDATQSHFRFSSRRSPSTAGSQGSIAVPPSAAASVVAATQGRFRFAPEREGLFTGSAVRAVLARGGSAPPHHSARQDMDVVRALQGRFKQFSDRDALYAGQGARLAARRGIPLRPASMGADMAATSAMQNRFKFAPQRDALYGGQAFRAAAQAGPGAARPALLVPNSPALAAVEDGSDSDADAAPTASSSKPSAAGAAAAVSRAASPSSVAAAAVAAVTRLPSVFRVGGAAAAAPGVLPAPKTLGESLSENREGPPCCSGEHLSGSPRAAARNGAQRAPGLRSSCNGCKPAARRAQSRAAVD